MSTHQLVGGRYQLDERIGSGGMGTVWLGTDQILRRRVAVKELHHRRGGTDATAAEAHARSLREARAAAALRHPNIVTVYDILEHDKSPFIVMEYVDGRSLKQAVVEDGPLPVELVTEIADGLISALAAAHEAGVVHRDVKPANVLLGAGGVVRLTDFGLASMQEFDSLTEPGAILGTPGYLSPEQARGKPTGPPADLFGLGATLYYAVEGVGPFERDEYLAMLVAITRHAIRAPQRAGALQPLLERLLVNDPAKRATLAEARALLAEGGARRRSVARRAFLATGAAGVLGAGVSAALVWAGGDETPRPPSGRVSPSPSRPAGLGRVLWQDDDLPKPAISGSLVVTGVDPLRAVDLNTGAERWRTETRTPRRVGLDENLVVGETDSEVIVLDAVTGRVRWRRRIGLAAIVLLGDIVLAELHDTYRLVAFDARTGTERWRLATREILESAVLTDNTLCIRMNLNGGGTGGRLHGRDRSSGRLLWNVAAGSGSEDMASGVGPGDLAYLYRSDYTKHERVFRAVHLKSGTQRWAATLASPDLTKDYGTPRTRVSGVVPAGGLVLVSITDTRLTTAYAGVHAFDATTGVLRWRRPLLSPSACAWARDSLYVGSMDSKIHELDPATGAIVSSVSTAGPVEKLSIGASVLVASIGTRAIAYELPTA